MKRIPAWVPITFLVWGHAAGGYAQPETAELFAQCESTDCAWAFDGGVRVAPSEDGQYGVVYSTSNEVLGYVALSTDLVDLMGYSGQPLVTLVAIDPDGTIVGVRIIHHSEPILLLGIPSEALTDFVDRYTGLSAASRIVVGNSEAEGVITVDSISGATVTALVQNQTVLETARTVARASGALSSADVRPGHFITSEPTWSWDRLNRDGALGHLLVTEEQMGYVERQGTYLELWFTIADAPHIGEALMSPVKYRQLMNELEPDEHLFVILGRGRGSFKGSAFVRGGIFDRVRLEQGLSEIVFRDTDYHNLSPARVEGAPEFREAAVFITRGGRLDPGAPYALTFLGSRYDRRSATSRDFREFHETHQLPEAVYVTDYTDEDGAAWQQAWRLRASDAALLISFLGLVMLVFTLRRWTFRKEVLRSRLHLTSMVAAVSVVGVYLGAQPSVTQLFTLLASGLGSWRWDVFLSEPTIFILWIFIATVSLIWGRGVFCGWVCPYGALSELVFKLSRKLGLRRQFELSDRAHKAARHLRYLVLIVLVASFLVSANAGEQMAEIEPFKSTFLVPAWTRPVGFFAWWALLLTLAVFWWRPFCRYLCPLGAGLGILSSLRLSGPKRRDFCTHCKICSRACEPRAIDLNGQIDPRECMSCMKCESTYGDVNTCPPLINASRLTKKVKSQGDSIPHDGHKAIEPRAARIAS